MKLDLYWKDIDSNSYNIATLENKSNNYILRIREKELKDAIKKGCIGIRKC